MRVVLMCGLPAAGKTTGAARLYAHAGGTLIRSSYDTRHDGLHVPVGTSPEFAALVRGGLGRTPTATA